MALMDRIQARNVFMVLCTLVALTLGTFGVLLWRIGAGLEVPHMLESLATLLLGTLTGSAVTLSAKPKVEDSEPTTVVNNQQSPPGGTGNVYVAGSAVTTDEPTNTSEEGM